MAKHLLALVAVLFSHGADAQLFNIPSGTSVAQQPHLAGSIVEQTTTSFEYKVFNALGDPEYWLSSGTVSSLVMKAVDGTYDFYWRINVTGFFSVGQITFDRTFGDVDNYNYRTDMEPGTAPTFVGLSGSPFGFSFYDIDSLMDGHLSSSLGAQSAFLFVDTQATAYARNTHFTLSSGGGLGARASGSSSPHVTFGPVTCPAPRLLGKLTRRTGSR
jgi:hypothetical protein